jgi:putative toxin-antitoxin system antitoxin component (TIGR02293 family)
LLLELAGDPMHNTTNVGKNDDTCQENRMATTAHERRRAAKAALLRTAARRKGERRGAEGEKTSRSASGDKPVLRLELKKFTRELTPLQTHDLVTKGIGVASLRRFMSAYQLLDSDQICKVIGTSERTLQRAAGKARPLDTNVSDRALRLASVTSQAIDVLGSQNAAERWLSRPALALDGRKPIDLLQSTEGTDLVKTLLTRMDYDVYA